MQRFENGGEVTLPSLMSERLEQLQSLDLGRPEVPSKREILTPALLKFFGSLMKITKSTQVPQIIINGEFIGDYDHLVKYLNKENDENS